MIKVDGLKITEGGVPDYLTFFWSEDRVFPLGVDYGRQCLIVRVDKNYLMFKVQGHETWSGVGFTSYYPTTYHVVKVDQFPDRLVMHARGHESTKGRGEMVYECAPGKKWRVWLDWVDRNVFMSHHES